MFLDNRYRSPVSLRVQLRKVRRLLFLLAASFTFSSDIISQKKYEQPQWWFGLSGAANFNSYTGTTRRVNEVTYLPNSFGRGHGTGFFAAALIEYHIPNSAFAFMLAQGIDDRKADFTKTDQELRTHIAYITVEPSLRISPLRSVPGLYIYGGPRLGFLVTSDFTYKRNGLPDYPDENLNPDLKYYISSLRKNPVSVQFGAGYDIHVSSKNSRQQFVISPFASYFPTMWRKNLRTIERLYLTTIRAGITLKIGSGRMSVTKVTMAVISDRDNDGIADINDRCPDDFGPASLQGCPDRDGDGIADRDDKCPDVFGYARYQGCPIPDRDKDGLNDEVDKCPDVFGLPRYQGCPIPDTDGDGVNDEEDKCITRPGPVSNKGCPVIAKEIIDRINFAAKNTFFSTGSYQLLPKSFKALDDVANLLRGDQSLMIDIDGHTDAQGSDESNMVLSDNRAAAVKNYLTGKGVDGSRLTSKGYGESRPVEDNNTAAGRAMNRRTEMTVRNF